MRLSVRQIMFVAGVRRGIGEAEPILSKIRDQVGIRSFEMMLDLVKKEDVGGITRVVPFETELGRAFSSMPVHIARELHDKERIFSPLFSSNIIQHFLGNKSPIQYDFIDSYAIFRQICRNLCQGLRIYSSPLI